VTIKVGYAEGKCPVCSKIIKRPRPIDTATCDCWRICPICGAEMTPYTPDLTLSTYGSDGKRDLKILMVCTNCKSPFFSAQEPVEVELA